MDTVTFEHGCIVNRPNHVHKAEDATDCNELGVALGKKGDLSAAVRHFEKALKIRPDYARACNNLGVALKALGNVETSIEKFRRAIQIDPAYAEAHWNLSFLLLLTGAFEEGWREYEWRFKKKGWNDRGLDRKRVWDGSAFSGRRLLVWGEQGFGDHIQFIRYLEMVKKRGGTVILEVPPELAKLFRSIAGIDALIESHAGASTNVAFDFHVPLLSLPGIFKTRMESIDAFSRVPYIYADSKKARDWQKRLSKSAFKIGLVWEGKPTDLNRACPLGKFASLAAIDGVRLYGLQKGEPARQSEMMSEKVLTNLGNDLEDFSDTAAVIENLDLVISVDTAALHLAGAMGKTAFGLIPFAPDWRWFLDREDSPWYPTIRLFRQKRRGSWDEAMDRLVTAVRDFVAAKRTANLCHISSPRRFVRKDSGEKSADIKSVIAEALRLYKGGDIHGARKICEKAIREVPANWEALRLLCVLYCQTGRADQIKGMVSEAASYGNRDHGDFLNLGNLLRSLGCVEDAMFCYQEALRLAPESAEVHYNIGNVWKERRDLTASVAAYARAVGLKQDLFDAYYNMGNAFNELGKADKALACYRKTLDIKPDHKAALCNAVLTLKDLGHFDDAVDYCRKALQSNPDSAEMHYNLGNILKEQGHLQQAMASYRNAIALQKDMVDAHFNMGNALKESGSLETALLSYEKALALAPNHIGALNNMALSFRDLGRIERAIELFDQALKLEPDHVEIRWNRALALLLLGDFSRGWQEYDVRFQRNERNTTYPRRLTEPLWDGSPFQGKTLLVHHEQGFGDTLQFVRYLPMVKARGGTVILEVNESLRDLCKGIHCVDEVVSRPLDQELGVAFDFYVPIMSLPRIFETDVNSIPRNIPYVPLDAELKNLWRDKLNGDDLTIGLVWAGNPGHKDDRNRSCPLDLFEPLTELSGVTLYGLQKDEVAPSEALLKKIGIVPLGRSFKNFSDTAGAIANLDLIISVDTAVAHLAGAMGKPVWVLLPFVPDWRWLLGREDSPWYPTARLFRQRQRGDWREVIQRVVYEVKKLAKIRKRRRFENQGERGNGQATSCSWVSDGATELVTGALQYYQAGDLEWAERICCHVLKNDPECVEALHLTALVHHARKEFEKAAELLGKAIEMNPKQAVFYHNLGAVYQEKGNLAEAISHYRQAIRLQPDLAEAFFNLGKALLEEKQFEEAIASFEKASLLGANRKEAYSKISQALLSSGRYDEAIALGEKIIQADPNDGEGYYIVGNGLKEKDQFEAALESYEKALQRNPTHTQSLVHKGLACQFLGRVNDAIAMFDRAIAIDKNHVGANLNRALALLLCGDYREGWKGYNWRFKTEDWKKRNFLRPDKPEWDGSALENSAVLVTHEQGLGDEIQFIRFLPMVKARGGAVIYETNPRLLRFLKGFREAGSMVFFPTGKSPDSESAFQIPLLSLPGLFGTTLETIPCDKPYFEAETALVDFWKEKLKPVSGFKIGISWQGNPSYRDDRHRSVPLQYFCALAKLKGLTLISLQKGHGLDQLQQIPKDVSILDLGPDLDESKDAFVHTAAVMKNLDLVITSDTALPHLAGALGVPVWLLLPKIPDWRWGLSGKKSPWYSSMKLFRQKKQNDWPGVFQEVCQEIQKFIQTNLF